jgi:glucan-binding YG repeat protein
MFKSKPAQIAVIIASLAVLIAGGFLIGKLTSSNQKSAQQVATTTQPEKKIETETRSETIKKAESVTTTPTSEALKKSETTTNTVTTPTQQFTTPKKENETVQVNENAFVAQADPNIGKNNSLTTFKNLDIAALKTSQQPGPNVTITNGTFKIVGAQNNQLQVNSGVDKLNLILPREVFEVNGYYFPTDGGVPNGPQTGIPLLFTIGSIIKVTADFQPLIANPAFGYDKIDYVLAKIYTAEVLGDPTNSGL